MFFFVFIIAENGSSKTKEKTKITVSKDKRRVVVFNVVSEEDMKDVKFDINEKLRKFISDNVHPKYFEVVNPKEYEVFLYTNGYHRNNLFDKVEHCVRIATKVSAEIAIVGKWTRDDKDRITLRVRFIDVVSEGKRLRQLKVSTSLKTIDRLLPKLRKFVRSVKFFKLSAPEFTTIPSSSVLVKSKTRVRPAWLNNPPKSTKRTSFFVGQRLLMKNRDMCKKLAKFDNIAFYIKTYVERFDKAFAMLKSGDDEKLNKVYKKIIDSIVHQLAHLKTAREYYESFLPDPKNKQKVRYNYYILHAIPVKALKNEYLRVINYYQKKDEYKSYKDKLQKLSRYQDWIFKFKKPKEIYLHDYVESLQEYFFTTDKKTALKIKAKRIKPKDNMKLIKGGYFKYGGKYVRVRSFFLDTFEVTNEDYKKFLIENPQWRKGNVPIDKADQYYLSEWDGLNYPDGKGKHPVRHVSWYSAMAYAKWVNKRLPDEIMWEYAAGGREHRKYSLTDHFKPGDYSFNLNESTPVGKFPANTYGVHDMSGSVWEWCYKAYPKENGNESYSLRYDRNALRDYKVLKGGSSNNSVSSYLKVSNSYYNLPNYTYDCGFRCAKPFKTRTAKRK